MGTERRHRHQDQAIAAAGLIVFWPALFFTHGHNARSAGELAHLKGEIEALESASAEESCGIQFNKVWIRTARHSMSYIYRAPQDAPCGLQSFDDDP